MESLINQLKTCLSNVYIFQVKAHSYHWNVTGLLFHSIHEFLGDLYSDVYGSIDVLAEKMRVLGVMAPMNIQELTGSATIRGDEYIPGSVSEMIANLQDDNEVLLAGLKLLMEMAEDSREYGLANYVQDRIEQHDKYKWQLKAMLI